MPNFMVKILNGTEVFACSTCPPDPDDNGEPNHRNIKGRFDCPVHQAPYEIGPQPDGIPKRIPCPGDLDGGSGGSLPPHEVDVQELMCTNCEDGTWHAAP